MVKNKNNQTIWNTRIKKNSSNLFQKVGNSLDVDKKLKNLKIYPINIGKERLDKVNSFFAELGIDNLEPYFDHPSTLAKTFSLRGLPTTIILNSKGEEFARIIGSINFDDENFINWLKNLN